eukprot:4233594-Prymnesium_polylepis.1
MSLVHTFTVAFTSVSGTLPSQLGSLSLMIDLSVEDTRLSGEPTQKHDFPSHPRPVRRVAPSTRCPFAE